jgi:hypothetical protein
MEEDELEEDGLAENESKDHELMESGRSIQQSLALQEQAFGDVAWTRG